jgi:hypothetical protein
MNIFATETQINTDKGENVKGNPSLLPTGFVNPEGEYIS